MQPETPIFENLLWAREGEVLVLTINRPKTLNALDEATLRELMQAVRSIGKDREIRAVVLAGAGDRAFVAGADITQLARLSVVEARAFVQLGHRLMRALEELEQPVVAAVRGHCLGGGLELALACDFIVAAEDARFGQPEIALGVIPGFGGTQRLLRRVGIGIARELVYLGEPIDSCRAAAVGLVDRVTASDGLAPTALALARTLAAKAPIALALAKRAVNSGAEMDLMSGCRLEVESFATTFATQDRDEGMRAFAEKRSPRWRGR